MGAKEGFLTHYDVEDSFHIAKAHNEQVYGSSFSREICRSLPDISSRRPKSGSTKEEKQQTPAPVLP